MLPLLVAGLQQLLSGSSEPMSLLSGAHTQYDLLAASSAVVVPQQASQSVASAHDTPLRWHLHGVRRSTSGCCTHPGPQPAQAAGEECTAGGKAHVPQMKLSPYLVAVEQHLVVGSVEPMWESSAAHLLRHRL